MNFYLGTNDVYWLWTQTMKYPLFISNRRASRYKNYKRSINPWALDSGGFTELSMFGEWRTNAKTYISQIRRYQNEIGMMEWASPQDYMCEPNILRKTGKTVYEHQQLTIDNYIELSNAAPELPIIPVLQGWDPDDYLRHRDQYTKRGIDLTQHDRVGMGTFCRRASFEPVHHLVVKLWQEGLQMHGYGVKTDGLSLFGEIMKSADSMAWSLIARRKTHKLCGEQHNATKCSNCRKWATIWADKTTSKISLRWPYEEQFLT